MNRTEVKAMYDKLVEELNLPTKSVVLGAGGALTMLGLRELTSDLDIAIPRSEFDKLRVSGKPMHRFNEAEVIEWDRLTDIHSMEGEKEHGNVIVDGVCIYGVPKLIKFKKWLSELPQRTEEKRAQDLVDLKALKKQLSEW